MFKLAYMIIKDFGALGIGIVQLIVIVYFGWKLFTNHLKHIQDQVNLNGKKVGIINSKITKTNKELVKVTERVATMEGRCGAYHSKGVKKK